MTEKIEKTETKKVEPSTKTKAEKLAEMLKKDDSKAAEVKEGKKAVAPAITEEFTDSKEVAIAANDRVKVRVGNKSFDGTITGLKTIDKDQFAHVLIDSQTKSKMFHTGDITFISKGTEVKETPKPVVTKKNGVSTYIAPEVDGSEEKDPTPKEEKGKKAPKVKAPKEPKVKKERKLQDAPAEGSKSAKIVEMLKAGKTNKEISIELDAHYSFVITIKRKYLSDMIQSKVADAPKAAAEPPVTEVPAEKLPLAKLPTAPKKGKK